MIDLDDIEDELIKGTTSRLKALNKVFFETISNYFVDNFSIGDDIIKYNSKNISVIEKLVNEIKKMEDPLQKIGKYILTGVNRILNGTSENLARFDKKARDSKVMERMLKHATVNVGANLKPDPIFTEFKEKALRLISRPNGVGLKELRSYLYNEMVEKGVSEKYFARWTVDLYSQYQRTAANEIRKEIGLKYAVYAGGLMDKSRDFCIERNGNTYSEEEIMSWADEDFDGKPDVYDPIVDLGGYNCRHRLDWISEELHNELKDGNDISED